MWKQVASALMWLAKTGPKDVLSKFRLLMKNNPKLSGAVTALSVYELYDLLTIELDSAEADALAKVIYEAMIEAGVPQSIVDGASAVRDFAVDALGDSSKRAAAKAASGTTVGPRDPRKLRIAELNAAKAGIPQTLLDNKPNVVDRLDAQGVADMRQLARFVRNEISPNHAFALQYHAYMREFLMMDTDNVKLLLESFA